MAHRASPSVVSSLASISWRSAGRLRRAAFLLAASLSSDCPLCQGPARGGRLCSECETDVCASMRGEPRCGRCALPRVFVAAGAACGCPLQQAPFSRTQAAFDYAAPADMLVLQLKNRMRLSCARALAALMAERARAAGWLEDGERSEADHGGAGGGPDHRADSPTHGGTGTAWVLVPVPASRASLSQRGFNPAAEIAAGVSRELGWPLRAGWLWRARDPRDGVKQSRLGRRGRQLAAEGAYLASPAVGGHRIALVDDVMTTGSTAQAAALALVASGAREVGVLVAARTPRPGG